jgi:adenylate cyclase
MRFFMAQELKRKLAAILSADVKGYSRLMGGDEEWTVRTLDTFKGVMKTIIPQHRGRVVDSTGDNLLAEFASVVDAVQAAVEIQQMLRAKNSLLPENRRMEFRIGINLGDVIEEGDRIFGDGVNIAARLEGLTEPGGICISGSAFEQIENKLPLLYDYLGEHEVKNITRPVRVYRVLMDNGVVKEKGASPKVHGAGRRVAAFGLVAALVIIASVALWQFVLRPTPPSHPPVEKADPQKMAYALPDKPSIAVLPFVNMSDDPQQEYFSDGMTEDLITDLSKISGLFVIARSSTFLYKGKPVKIRQVAEDLGVRYVLEGSVRQAGDQVRINAQLIDAASGQHLWAERYDGSMKDVFSLQDKINQKIVAALAVKLTSEEKLLVSQKGTNEPAAYEEFLKGREHYLKNTKEDFAKAEAFFKRAIELDPNYGRASAALALLYYDAASQGTKMREAFKLSYNEVRLIGRKYLKEAMKDPSSTAYQVAGLMDLFLRQHDEAISQIEKALALDPNDSVCHGAMSWALSMAGRPAEGLEYAKSGMRLDPLNPARHLVRIGLAHFCMGEWQETVTATEKALKLNPELQFFGIILASAYAQLGRDEEAKAAYQAYCIRPPFDMYFWPFKDRRVSDSFLEGLLKAGVPPSRLEWSKIYQVSKENQLTGDQLRAFYYPSTTAGYSQGGMDWSLKIAKDGTVTRREPLRPGVEDTGKSWVEGDKLWFQFQKHYFGIAYCTTTFRNPGGTPEGKNEHIGFNDVFTTRFSRVR